MKLILSSCDFINDKSKQVILDNLPKDLKDIKVLFIPSGKATKEDFNCSKYYDRLIDDGFSKKNIYILDYYNITPSMNLNIDVLYVGGGNTFLTLDKIRTTGFDKYIINYLNNGVTYIGGSAGAHIVTKNIEHILPFDENIPNIIAGIGGQRYSVLIGGDEAEPVCSLIGPCDRQRSPSGLEIVSRWDV